jgi:hypothetical protein
MTRDEELAIREAAMFCLNETPTGGRQHEMVCVFCGWRVFQRMPNLGESVAVDHTEKHLGGILTPKDAATICSLRALDCKPEDIVQQVTGHPPCIAADPRTNQIQFR